MLIQCTKKLLDELKIKPAPVIDEEPPLLSWHANMLTLNRKKVIVLVNDLNRYVVVLYGLKARDLQKLDEYVINAIRRTLKEEGIKEEIIKRYLDSAGEIVFTKTKNRTTVARLNKACENVQYFDHMINNETLYQYDLSKWVSSLLVGDGKKYIHPNEEMYMDLAIFAGEPIFSCKAALLKVTLDLEKFKVWRRIVVPVHLTFPQLHHVIQIAFGWKDHHLHEFYIFNDEGNKPIMNLVSDEEALEVINNIPIKLEMGIKLSEYVPARMNYIYDLGDYWRHRIEVEEVIPDYDKNYPICLEAHGDTPPEDVGGEGGYEEFLKIIADENHPEYKTMAEWGRQQGYKKLDLDEINFGLEKRI